MSPVSASYWNISGYIIFWALFAIAFGLFTQRVYFLFRLVSIGQEENRFQRMGYRIKSMLSEVVLQRCSLKTFDRKDLLGIGHAFMVWGFGIFIVGYIIFIGLGGGFGLSSVLAGSIFKTVYFSIMDIAGLFIFVAIIWAFIKRYLVKPERLNASNKAGGNDSSLLALILTMMIVLVLLHYCIEAFGYAAYDIQISWPPLGAAFAGYLAESSMSENMLITVYRGVWWLNYAIILCFLAYAPHSKHLHPLASPFNMLFKSLDSKGEMKPIHLEAAKTFGVCRIHDFTWKHLLDLFSCTECGKCSENCPAQVSGKTLDPRGIIINLRDHLLDVGHELFKTAADCETLPINIGKTIIGEVVKEEMIWACLDCGACQEVCPVNIEQLTKITDIKRNLVLEQASIPLSGEEALKSIERNGHPWRGIRVKRSDWVKGLDIKILGKDRDIDILYWVGCTSAFEERSMKVAVALAMLLKQAGVNLGILGDEENCCGDPARHLGSEYMFQLQAEKNIDLLHSYKVKRIVTGCPHCYNTLKCEYRHFGGDFEVMHHTEFLDKLMQEGSIGTIKGAGCIAAYHDPCYLGRFNNVYEPPRRILKNLPGVTLVEIVKNKERSFCCGAGGGHLWLEEQRSNQRINEIRCDQTLDTKAQIVATACPYCLQMFEDGINVKEAEESLKVMDIAELVIHSQQESSD